MGTTRTDLGNWFDQGVADDKAYMVVWCDTYDYSDYPAYYGSREDAQQALDKNGQNMQKAMECYDLRKSKAAQLALARSWALRPHR